MKSEDIIDEVNNPEYTDKRYYLFYSLLRYVNKVYFSDLQRSFCKVETNSNSYPLLAIYFKIKDRLELLDNLFPIIEFTNMALNHYSYKITRVKAKELKIKDFLEFFENVELLETKYKEFQRAWMNVKNIVGQYDCRVLYS